jgi:hypothetical protein
MNVADTVNQKGSLPVKPAMADQRPTYTNYEEE